MMGEDEADDFVTKFARQFEKGDHCDDVTVESLLQLNVRNNGQAWEFVASVFEMVGI